jgi:glucosamine--fructose-6-phosphate aminotransferase (isomerizing)
MSFSARDGSRAIFSLMQLYNYICNYIDSKSSNPRGERQVFMCGIVGYTGSKNAQELLLDALSRLEYRGYDSAGIAVSGSGGIQLLKTAGRLENLRQAAIQASPPLEGRCGIGHTRWATHGRPSAANAHPHQAGRVTLVHNGILENDGELRSALTQKGCAFQSETDTEAAAWLLDDLYHGDPIAAIQEFRRRLRGSYAFGILFSDRPGELYALRQGSPLIAAKDETGFFLASDIPAVLPLTRTYALLEEGCILHLTPDSARILYADGSEAPPSWQLAAWSMEQAQKDGYAHFMRKEIAEQPKVLRDTVLPRLRDGLPDFFSHDGIPDSFWNRFDRICVAACGTAMHAGCVGKALIETHARIPVNCEIASEFRYQNPILSPRTLVLLISQSGETADTLAALRLAKKCGAPTLAVVNTAGSSMEREADQVIHTYAGPEIAVASTKAYSVQLAVLYLLAAKLSLIRGAMCQDAARQFLAGLSAAIRAVPEAIALEPEIRELVRDYQDLNDLFFLGRGLDYTQALEGSLKLKEISYIHCEAYAAGELKHGTISLITPGTPVIALATQDALFPKMLSNIREVQSRGAEVLLLCKNGAQADPSLFPKRLELPALEDPFLPLVTAPILQLIAYHTALLRGCDVDKPRNLAKSVTVE